MIARGIARDARMYATLCNFYYHLIREANHLAAKLNQPSLIQCETTFLLYQMCAHVASAVQADGPGAAMPATIRWCQRRHIPRHVVASILDNWGDHAGKAHPQWGPLLEQTLNNEVHILALADQVQATAADLRFQGP